MFGLGDGDPDVVLALHREAESVLAELRAGTGRWTRWRSDADPRPLLARTERPGESAGAVVAAAAGARHPPTRRRRPHPRLTVAGR